MGNAFCANQLLAGWQQARPVQMRPAIVLAGGEFDEIRLQGNAQLDDVGDFVDVVPVGNEVQHHGVAVGLDRPGHFQLLREGFSRACQQVVDLLIAGLEADLDVVQPGVLEVAQLLFGQADAGGDQVGVEAQLTGLLDQHGKVVAHQWLAAGKAQLCCPHVTGLTKYPEPLLGAQFLALLGKIQRVGAIGALQRAAVSQLGEEPQGQADLGLGRQAIRQVRSSAVHGRPP
ncbi:hypothetical protein D3C80_822100 [compost metagenome]